MTKSTRTYAPRGASLDERLHHYGWTEVTRRPELGPCWEWNAGRHRNGYGKIFDGERTATTHRVAYRAWRGSIPEGLAVLHQCDNRPCINPDHLFLGTIADNHADMIAKGRANSPTKLTDEQVAEILAAYTGTRGQQTELARAYGVSGATISLIVRGKHRSERGNDQPMGARRPALRTAG